MEPTLKAPPGPLAHAAAGDIHHSDVRFGYLRVPIYNVACKLTGIGGQPNKAAALPPPLRRSRAQVTVEFVGQLNEQAPWESSRRRPPWRSSRARCTRRSSMPGI